MNRRACFTALSCALVVAVMGVPGISKAQDYYAGPPVTASADTMAVLTDDQIEQLLAPVALYPDSLLAVLLPAATYPDDFAAAARWQAEHPNVDPSAADDQPWDPSVKALLHYPEVLKSMADSLDWVQAVGAAYLYQNDQVMQAIQNLRLKAVASGSLESTPEQQVVVQDDTVEILPSNPDYLYVPTYDPSLVYVERRPLRFGGRCAIGNWLIHYFDWHHRVLYTGNEWHHGWDYRDHRWVRLESPRYYGPSERVWSHDVAKPRPMLPRAVLSADYYSPHAGHNHLVLPPPVAHPPHMDIHPTLWAQEQHASDRGHQSLASHLPDHATPGPIISHGSPSAFTPPVTRTYTPSGHTVATPSVPVHTVTPTPTHTITTPTPGTPTHTITTPTPSTPVHTVTPASITPTHALPTPTHTFSSPGTPPTSGVSSSFTPDSGSSAHTDSSRGRASLDSSAGRSSFRR